MARLRVMLGVACLAALAYWIAALHLPLPLEDELRAWYGKPSGRLGPWGIYLLALGGLLLIGSGLKDLGLTDSDD